jgi:hypothetical protein
VCAARREAFRQCDHAAHGAPEGANAQRPGDFRVDVLQPIDEPGARHHRRRLRDDREERRICLGDDQVARAADPEQGNEGRDVEGRQINRATR